MNQKLLHILLEREEKNATDIKYKKTYEIVLWVQMNVDITTPCLVLVRIMKEDFGHTNL